MRTTSVLLWTSLCCLASLEGDLLDFYVANNTGTIGSPGTFISIVDVGTNTTEAYINSNGFDLTHPIDIHLTSTGAQAYVTCDSVNAVYVIDISLRKVVGAVDDTLGPFNAPQSIDVNLNVIPNIAYISNEAGGPGNRGTVCFVDESVNIVKGVVDDTLGPLNLPIAVGISDNGKTLLVANFDGNTVSVVDTASNQVTGYVVNHTTFPFSLPIYVAWSGSTKAYISNLGNGFVSVVEGNAVTGIVSTGTFPGFFEPTVIYEGPDGTMYILDNNGHVYLVDPLTDAVIDVFTGTFSNPSGIAITPDNVTAYVSNGATSTISIVDVASRAQTGLVTTTTAVAFYRPTQMQFAPSLPPPPPSATIPLQPICIQGKQKTDRFAVQSELFNTISWCASPSLSVVRYHLYRNGVLIQSINANDPLTFKEHDVSGTITYSVTAVNATGDESPAVTVSVP